MSINRINLSTSNLASASEWQIDTDIYNTVEQLDNLKSRFIDDQEETTLALGMFGFITDTEAKKIQIATEMTGELGNEMFPARARLEKNVLTHAIYCNIEGINANPSRLTIMVSLKEDDLAYFRDTEKISEDSDIYQREEVFRFDCTAPIFIGSYEFHFDYDIILEKITNFTNNKERYSYIARYDMGDPITDRNNISTIINQYLSQPVITNINNQRYISFTATIRQVHIEEINDTMITRSIIDNKSYTFSFSDQLADFEVYVKNGPNAEEHRLFPYFYGSSLSAYETDYCWYLYINTNTVRVSFDQNSYIPGLNSSIRIVAKTTLGAEGNFTYDTESGNAVYVDFASKSTKYKKLTCLVQCLTDSVNGKDRKSSDELRKLLPKMALSRGYITTETDLNNYFNLISDENNRLKLQKKVDNQLHRIWYAYFLLKDKDKNVIPTNTIMLNIKTDDGYIVPDTRDKKNIRYVVPCGTTFKLEKDKNYAEYIYPENVPSPFTDSYFDEKSDNFYYRNPYNIVINTNPLYAAYYLTIVNSDSYFEYQYVNENTGIGFISLRNHFERNLLIDHDQYKLSFNIQQSVIGIDSTKVTDKSFGLIKPDIDSGEIHQNNIFIKCYLVLYQNSRPYRWVECNYVDGSIDTNNMSMSWEAIMKTDDAFDTDNRIKLTGLYEAGYNSTNYGFFDNNIEAYLYIAAQFTDENGNQIIYKDINNDFETIIPGQDGYTLVNIYKVHNGLTLFDNYTNVMNTRIRKNVSENENFVSYDIFGVPMIGEHFFDHTDSKHTTRSIETAEEAVTYYLKELNYKKVYIDYCLELIENSMNIDFKYFNTYGPSKTYTIGYIDDLWLDHLDLTLNFKVKLVDPNDTLTRDNIIADIKAYVEDVNDLGNLHFPNLVHDIKEKYNDSIVYIDFRYFNELDSENSDNPNHENHKLGANHIQLQEPEDPHIVPEFLNVRNRYNQYVNNELTLEPCINVEIVS